MNYETITWNNESYTLFLKELDNLKDLKYKEFNSKLIPETSLKFIGIRVPIMREIAKKIVKGDWKGFLELPISSYYEVTFIRVLVIGYIKESKESVLNYLKKHISEIENWAVCDCCISNIKIIKKEREYFYPYITESVNSCNPWEIRSGIVALMSHYMDKEYATDILEKCINIKNDEYYVKMGIAWLISILFINFREETLKYLESGKLSSWVQNKAIQKIRESYRVTESDKELVLLLKSKK